MVHSHFAPPYRGGVHDNNILLDEICQVRGIRLDLGDEIEQRGERQCGVFGGF
jgi:hypothetical protein